MSIIYIDVQGRFSYTILAMKNEILIKHMKKPAISLTVFAIVVLLAGCGRYMVGSERFHSSSDALKKQTEIQSNILNGITPTNNPIHGTALVLIPSDAEIQKNYIRFSSDPSRFGNEQTEWLITSARNNCQLMADSIRKRGIFDSVSVARHNGNPASFTTEDYEFIIFLDVDGWYIRMKDKARPISLPIDKSKPVGAPRVLSFLDVLYQQVTALRAK